MTEDYYVWLSPKRSRYEYRYEVASRRLLWRNFDSRDRWFETSFHWMRFVMMWKYRNEVPLPSAREMIESYLKWNR